MPRKNNFCPYSHRNIGKRKSTGDQLDEIANNKPWVMAMVEIDLLEPLQKSLYPASIHKKVGDEKLLSVKYWIRFETLALNELLGRPVPNVINLYFMIQDEARSGDFTRLDRTLGFVDNEGNQVEMAPIEQQLKMNDIMMNILEAKGVNFYALIERLFIDIYEETQWQKKQKVSKMKRKNQRKLGAVTKTVPQKSTSKESEEKDSTTRSKIKTAKDHEHYRKSQRPARL